MTQYVAVLNCNELEQVVISGKSGFPMFQSIKVYAGELDEPTLRGVQEEGDANSRYITGLTDKHYTVTDLMPGGMFYYRVKTYYIDGTSSAWSKSRSVTLFDNAISHIPGDVDHDGGLSIGDVTMLIDYLLGSNNGICTDCADIDGDNEVTIADVTLLIDLMLKD